MEGVPYRAEIEQNLIKIEQKFWVGKKQRLGKPKKHKNLATQRLFFLEHIITTN